MALNFQLNDRRPAGYRFTPALTQIVK